MLWICLVACGGGVSVSTNASNVCSEIAEVACHNVYKCCSEGEIEDFLGVDEPRTEPQCKEDVRRTCERNIAKLDAAIEEKRVRFDSDLMNNCLEAIVAPSGDVRLSRGEAAMGRCVHEHRVDRPRRRRWQVLR